MRNSLDGGDNWGYFSIDNEIFTYEALIFKTNQLAKAVYE